MPARKKKEVYGLGYITETGGYSSSARYNRYKHIVAEEEIVREFNRLKKSIGDITTSELVEEMINLEKKELGKRQLYLWTYPIRQPIRKRTR